MPLKICFLSIWSPYNKKTWSGIAFHLFSQMSRYHDVQWISPWQGEAKMHSVFHRILWARGIVNRLLKRKFTWHYFLNSLFLGRTIQNQIADKDFDLIVVGAGESILIAHLNTKIPIIYINDTTFSNMVDYYPWHTGLSKSALRQGHGIERLAIQKSYHVIYCSEWAANSAIDDYGADKAKVSVISFGANIMRVPSRGEALARRQSDKCRLLFVGVNWLRKGGDIAYQTFLQLRKAGLDCSLTIIGCDPVLEADPDLTIIPFLDKNNESEFAEFYRIFLESDIFLLPTRAECFGIVFSEAAAFGVPVVTTDTGGVSGAVREGVNGYCLPYDATALDYSRRILEMWNDKELFKKLIVSSRDEYDTRLNWDQWIRGFNSIAEALETKTPKKHLAAIKQQDR